MYFEWNQFICRHTCKHTSARIIHDRGNHRLSGSAEVLSSCYTDYQIPFPKLRHCNNEILLHCSRFSLFCILIKIFGNSTCALHTRLVELFTHASCPVAVVGRGLFESSPWRLLWCTFHLWHRMLNQWPLIWFHPAELLLSTVEFLLRWLSIWECPLLIQKGMYSRRS